jgi:putative hydrolase of the HAD superfamily
MKYQAVVFDLFGTLIDKLSLKARQKVLVQMASVLRLPSDDFKRLWFATFEMRGLGVFPTIEANIQYILNELGLKSENGPIRLAAQINLDYIADSFKPRPDALEVLGFLKSRGYKTGLISSCSPEIPPVFRASSLANYFDVTLFSCLTGIDKPDIRIYQMTVEQLGVEPFSCLYVGDGDGLELTGAAHARMHPLLVSNPDEDSGDVYRVGSEANTWEGAKVTSLAEIMNLIG